MLFKATISDSTLELLTRLMRDEALKGFVLAEGTALALQVGHRISVDLDLFSADAFDENNLADYLRANYHFTLDFISKNTLKGEINGVQIDCIAHQYPWIDSPVILEGIRLASYRDIAAMKLNAISGNGTRLKDFIDLAYLSEKISFNQMIQGYEKKYQSNPIIPVKSITWFDDIHFNEPVNMLTKTKFDWKIIAERLKNMHSFPDRIFKSLS